MGARGRQLVAARCVHSNAHVDLARVRSEGVAQRRCRTHALQIIKRLAVVFVHVAATGGGSAGGGWRCAARRRVESPLKLSVRLPSQTHR